MGEAPAGPSSFLFFLQRRATHRACRSTKQQSRPSPTSKACRPAQHQFRSGPTTPTRSSPVRLKKGIISHVGWLLSKNVVCFFFLSTRMPYSSCLPFFFLHWFCKNSHCSVSSRENLYYPWLNLPPYLNLVTSNPSK